MAITKFIQVGRVVCINYGADVGKLGVVVDIVNDTRVLIDGEHIKRQVIPIRRLTVTKFAMNKGKETTILLGQRTPLVKKVISKFDLNKKFAESSLGKKITSQKTRQNLGDFDRFKVMILKKNLNRKIRQQVNKLAKNKK